MFEDFDDLAKYYKQMNACQVLEPSIIRELVRKAQKGDQHSRNLVIKHNMRLAINIALKSRNRYRTVSMEDKVQYACIGLVKAVEKFEPDRINPETKEPYAFSTYATWWIKQSIDRECMNTCANIRVPIHRLKTYGTFLSIREKLYYRGIHNPVESDFEPYFVKGFGSAEYNHCITMPQTTSDEIYADGDDSPLSIYDITEGVNTDTVELLTSEASTKVLHELLKELSPREIRVLELRFGLNGNEVVTLEEAGKDLNLTRERVRQIQTQAISKLRERIKRTRSEELLS